ncbi:uncharacterized protein LOC125045054 [Penaeus chinensis]|uniref:uncharacterized protein LOC125045054 n=1 Tax=Penaeus chinensis TaxID=139456 RepID=UPI001FB621D1|nr:uncharacterized protein LOC125045054 [Penaeus chinensis]
MKVAIALLLTAACVVASPAKLPGQAHGHTHTPQPIIPYNFGYEVADAATNNFQNRAEIKTPNGDVFGSYSWLMPTNEILTLSYNVTGTAGFQYSINITPVGAAATTA